MRARRDCPSVKAVRHTTKSGLDPITTRRSSLIKPFYPALDGIRALATLFVFSWHYCRLVFNNEVFTWGWVGVNLFFVLSGFLITGILVDSLHCQRYFRDFYIRRTLRIFPLYYAIWLLFLLATPLLHVQWNRYVAAMAFFIGNFFKAGVNVHANPGFLHYIPSPGVTTVVLVDHFWSLCVEEQFYLVWPFLIWTIREPRRLLFLCLCMIAITPIGRIAYQVTHAPTSNMDVLYYNSFSRADALFLGAAIALWLRLSAPSPHFLRKIAIASLIAPFLILFSLRSLESNGAPAPLADPLTFTIGFTLINIAAGGLLLLSIESKSLLVSVLQGRPFVLIGRVGYGLYIFSQLLYIELIRHMRHFNSPLGRYLFPLVAFLISLAISLISFRYLESPFLGLRGRFAPRPGAVEDPPPVHQLLSESAPIPQMPYCRP